MSVFKPRLYGYYRSSCTWRVRIVLNLKKIAYDYHVIDLSKGDNRTPEFLAMNPRGQVPVLSIEDGGYLADSVAIIEYLEEKYPNVGPSLFPKSLEAKAVVRSLAYFVTSGIQPLQNLNNMMYVAGKDAKKAEAHCGYFIGKGLDVFEKELAKTAGKYAVGDELSLVDVMIPAQVYNAHRFKVDMSKYPTINRVNNALSEIPEFIQADAWHQSDTPAAERKN